MCSEKAPRLATNIKLNKANRRRYVTEGKSVSLKCDLFGFPEPEFTWTVGQLFHNLYELSSSVGYDTCRGLKTCVVSNVRERKSYNCVARNKYGTGSMSFLVIKLAKTQIEMDPIIRAVKGDTAILLPSFNHDNYIKDYNITWFKLGTSGDRTVLTSQSYLKGPVLKVYRELKIGNAKFNDSGDYLIKVQTQFDFDQKTVNLVIVDLPQPPKNIQVQNVEKSVKVSFEPGFNNYAEIKTYDIEFAILTDPNRQSEWRKMVTLTHQGSQLSRQEAIVSDSLIPFTKYSVRARARNQVGLSLESRADEQSESVITTQPARPVTNPALLQITGHNPAELLIQWEAVPEMYYNGSNFQYVLEYCQNDYPTQLCELCSNWQKEILAAPATQFILQHYTAPYKRFSVKLRSRNSVNLGPTPHCEIGYSGQARPSSSPTQLAVNTALASPVGKDFISLRWDRLGRDEVNGKLTNYLIKYKREGKSEEQLSAEREEVILQKLHPGQTYSVRVAATNVAGNGPFTDYLIVSTKEDRPGPPQDLKVTQIWPDRLKIWWKAPLESNGVIRGNSQLIRFRLTSEIRLCLQHLRHHSKPPTRANPPIPIFR